MAREAQLQAADSSLAEPPSRWLRGLSWSGSLLVFGGAAWLLHRYVSHLAWRDVVAAWSELPARHIAYSVMAAAVSFAMLALFDVLAARTVVGDRVSAGFAAFAGAVTQGISNTLGFHAITGTALRYRLYAAEGIGAGDVARIVGVVGLGVALGFVVVITGALCWQPAITHGWGRLPGTLLVLALVALLIARADGRRGAGPWRFPMPGSPRCRC